MLKEALDNRQADPDDVLIVGGSLVGLTFALACAARGILTSVIERRDLGANSGSALGIDVSLLLGALRLEKDEAANLPPLTESRQALSWCSLHRWLREAAEKRPEITLIDAVTISEVVQGDDFATAVSLEGSEVQSRIIVGADGYRSVVRRAVDPTQPYPQYAGYLLWRGLVSEKSLPPNSLLPAGDEGVALVNEGGHRLVGYPVAGEDGSLLPGRRLLSFSWYDKTRGDLLREAGCISPAGHVLSSLKANTVADHVRRELYDLAERIWPEPWRSIIRHAIETKRIFATPVAEYIPRRLHCERLALIGDAAHVVSPWRGMGFKAGISDADALAESLGFAFDQSQTDLPEALASYGRSRLTAAQQLVIFSREQSREFVRGERPTSQIAHRQFFIKKT